MASVKTGIIIGVIAIVIAGAALAFSSLNSDYEEKQEISSNIQNNDDTKSEEPESYINEEGRKVIVIEAKDSLSIND